jgi:hypothetical protein
MIHSFNPGSIHVSAEFSTLAACLLSIKDVSIRIKFIERLIEDMGLYLLVVTLSKHAKLSLNSIVTVLEAKTDHIAPILRAVSLG